MSEINSYVATPADIQFAADFNAATRPAPADPVLSSEQFAADEANPTNTIALSNGASLTISQKGPAQTLVIGEADPHGYITSTKIEALQRDADYLVEGINALDDPKTGLVRPGYESDREKLVLQLHQVQRTAAHERTYGEAQRRAAANSPTQGIAQLQAEADYQDRRAADDTARALDEMFGRVRIG